MSSAAPSPAEIEFRFVGGDPALDLVNTVDWTDQGLAHERLPDYAAVVSWAAGAGVVPVTLAPRLRRLAAADPREARAAHGRVLRVRALLRAVFGEETAERAGALREFNALLGEALGRLELAAHGDGSRRLGWRWRGMEQRLDALLWPVLRSAAELLASPEADRVRTCAGPDCGWMYVDRSRNGFRRWCQMRTCGTREKTRRRRTGAGE